MKKILFTLFLGTLMFFTLVACGSGNEEKASSDSNTSGESSAGYDIVEQGKLTFAASGEFRPFSMTTGGEMTGFDIDVGNAVAKELGLEPVQEKSKFAAIVEGVKSGRYDIAVASHTITEERAKEVDFSTPYYYSGAQIFTRPDSNSETLEDLEDLEIAVSKGSTYVKFAEKVTDKIKVYDSDVVALQALAKGRHDAVITDFLTGKEAIGEGLKVRGKKIIDRSDQAIAVAKGNDKLLEDINAALKTLRENGTLEKISKKYFSDDITTVPE
ncbi:transporter substrate-binding domain-containing protein [Halobacillus shinanisalinarum]|uniref:Transporter substrate-binding domain-containing protein n=1 Tax=Halobacillus shinanisalinarum TaxID=2932258 RepID=A0ABY4H1U6_9BACI|nr:transporter substrate-binding domain-containing protein [Halobacillus shinanisalinarum]UOQ93890.1 transporter substrate-binding domain-containing protein [Halobacillus shinanisalinarum]